MLLFPTIVHPICVRGLQLTHSDLCFLFPRRQGAKGSFSAAVFLYCHVFFFPLPPSIVFFVTFTLALAYTCMAWVYITLGFTTVMMKRSR